MFTVIVLLSVAAIPAWAVSPAPDTSHQVGGGPRIITGSYKTTNPYYPLTGAEPGVLLYDMTGEVLQDFDFRLPLDAQVLGTLEGDIVSGTYVIELPEIPRGIPHDFDGDDTTLPAVQVFAAATYTNFLGDVYINRGESALNLSVRMEPMSYHIIGGYAIVWSASEGEQFPGGLGADSAAFTADDPLITLPAGWSVISLETDPFTVVRDETVDIPIVESFGTLHDYSAMSYQEAWDTLFQRTRETYPFTAEKNLDWDAIYDEITPLVQAAQSNLDFHLAIIHLGELIPDTHIGFVSVPVLQQYLMGGVGIVELGITDAEQVVIGAVVAQSPADNARIQMGDVLVSVDGVPALQALDETPLLVNSASTVYGRRFLQAATMLQGPVGSSVTLVWRTPDDAEHRAQLVRTLDASALFKSFGGEMLTADVISARMLDSGVGYIQITSFLLEVNRADAVFANELQTLIDAGAKGIILDIRDNGGGLVQLAMAMVGRFFPDYRRLFDLYYADGEGGFAYRGFIEILASDPYYDGPVAVLVDEMTGSSGDLFAYVMQSDHRAIVVGYAPTGGAVGEIIDGQYELPGGLTIQIPTGRPVDPITGEVLIEGSGVIPDILVPRTWENLVSPQDDVLLAAEAAILDQQ
jgi:C-terminal processing protease CtpA/Prc